jgi:hypothetical protein
VTNGVRSGIIGLMFKKRRDMPRKKQRYKRAKILKLSEAAVEG